MASVDATALDEGAAGRRRTLRVPKLPKSKDLGLDTILTIAATVMVPLGVVVVLLGWYGAARTPFLFEQIPYLISGGLLGVGLLFAGSALYLGTWIMRLHEQQRLAHEELLEAVRALRDETPRRSAVGDDTDEIPVVRAGVLLATPAGTMFHRSDCAVVSGRDDVRQVDPSREDLEPCKLCDPLGQA